MKKLIIAIAPLILALLLPGASAQATSAAGRDLPLDKSDYTSGEIFVNGAQIEAPRPSVTGGVIMLPLRAIAEALGYEVNWDDAERRVNIGKDYALWIGKPVFSEDGGATTREFGPPPELIEARTFVPISMFNFGFSGCSAKIEDGIVMIESLRQ